MTASFPVFTQSFRVRVYKVRGTHCAAFVRRR